MRDARIATFPVSTFDRRVQELFALAIRNPYGQATALVEACRWRARAEELLAEVAKIDPMWEAQVKALGE